MTETGVGFKSPPEGRVRKYDWEAIAKRCRRKPGEWYLVFKQDKQTYATTIRNRNLKALRPEHGFEIRTANNNIKVTPRVCDLYVRYVPENDTTKEK